MLIEKKNILSFVRDNTYTDLSNFKLNWYTLVTPPIEMVSPSWIMCVPFTLVAIVCKQETNYKLHVP